MDIIYKSKNLVVINKPQGIGAQADKIGDADAMTLTSQLLREANEAESLWLVHRLDRVVGGLLAFARNKSTAALFSSLAPGDMVKEYFAVVEGVAKTGEMRDFLYKDTKKSKAFVVDSKRNGVKEAVAFCTLIKTVETERGTYSLVRVRLETGRYHQIRAQLSSRKTPIVGDGKYGSKDNGAKFPALFSQHLRINLGRERIDLSLIPDLSVYPWCLFDADFYK